MLAVKTYDSVETEAFSGSGLNLEPGHTSIDCGTLGYETGIVLNAPGGASVNCSVFERNEMKKALGLFLMMVCFFTAPGANSQASTTSIKEPNINDQISDFVRRVFQDKCGNMWFGTNGDGVIRYEENSLEYFSIKEGFGGVAVRGIVEDKEGNVWFGTNGGVTKYDGEFFTNFTEQDGLINNDVWSIFIDSKGIIWIGTLQGACRFNGEVFTPFELPETEPDYLRGVTSARIVHSIMEDSKGKMWFGTNGGAYIYDGKSLSNISEKDGLCHDSVNCILEGKDGDFWFATHHNGVCRWDGTSFTHFTPEDGVQGTEVWDLFGDKSGNIWFPVEGFGLYRYDGNSFTNFSTKDGLASHAR